MNKIKDRQKLILAALVVAAFLMFVILVIAEVRQGGQGEHPNKWGAGNGDDTGHDIDNSGETVVLPDYITVDLLPINEYSRPGEPTDEITGIVIHYVGNPNTSAQANRNYFAGLAKSGATSASSNFIVGLEGEVIECVPLGEIAYASNNRNHDTISIECCHPDEGGKFNDATYASLIKLCRFLVDLYDLGPEDIIRHYDVTGKLCPVYYVENEDAWHALVEDIFNVIPDTEGAVS